MEDNFRKISELQENREIREGQYLFFENSKVRSLCGGVITSINPAVTVLCNKQHISLNPDTLACPEDTQTI